MAPRKPTARSVGEGSSKRRPSSTSHALAKPGDPLVLAGGEIVQDIHTPEEFKPNQAMRAQDFRSSKRRSLKDLPARPGVVNAVATVLMYTMLGLTDREIADVLKVSVDEIEEIRQHTAYAECFDVLVSEIISANSGLLQGRIAGYSHAALSQVAHLSRNAKNEVVSLKASQDILDRSGARPQDNAQRRDASGSELRIVIVDNEKQVNVHVNGREFNDV